MLSYSVMYNRLFVFYMGKRAQLSSLDFNAVEVSHVTACQVYILGMLCECLLISKSKIIIQVQIAKQWSLKNPKQGGILSM